MRRISEHVSHFGTYSLPVCRISELLRRLAELIRNFEIKNIPLTLNSSGKYEHISITRAQRQGKEVKVFPYFVGIPAKGDVLATGFPPPPKPIYISNGTQFGILGLDTSGILKIDSPGTTSTGFFLVPFSYFTA